MRPTVAATSSRTRCPRPDRVPRSVASPLPTEFPWTRQPGSAEPAARFRHPRPSQPPRTSLRTPPQARLASNSTATSTRSLWGSFSASCKRASRVMTVSLSSLPLPCRPPFPPVACLCLLVFLFLGFRGLLRCSIEKIETYTNRRIGRLCWIN